LSVHQLVIVEATRREAGSYVDLLIVAVGAGDDVVVEDQYPRWNPGFA
jgi:hypothetical protein